ncbi:LacI family transcriptional regulator [Nitratireductor aestuarii]|uniref:LacI family transcriptional regulator n=1 Tax=Nitratireductor aestuarii TaxID=1735103 RepID=A0A916W4D5_9HYPH|nr:LacI family DNA-binding transcriptional regulator [Nitratireductor aestuarii]GGA65292.1 LacI family transcriptional regulator [Nitratireductor aestuarii]
MVKRATIKDVAARAGVSIATVSNVFSGKKAVNPDLAKKVEEAAAALSYRLDRNASQLRSGRVQVVGMLVPNLDDTFFTSLVERVERLAHDDGYEVLVASSRDNPQLEISRLNALLGWRPSGLIAVPCSNAIPQPIRSEIGRLPMVLADRIGEDNLPIDTVTMDNVAAGQAAAELLIPSHRDILIAASNTAIRPIADRIAGISSVVETHYGVRPRIVELTSNINAGAEIFCDWLSREARPEGVICLTNVTTLAALQAFAALNIDIPEDVSLIGFDDYTWMTARKVPLSAVRQPVEEMGQAIWNCLSDRMAGGDVPTRHIVLPGSLQVRRSVRSSTSA